MKRYIPLVALTLCLISLLAYAGANPTANSYRNEDGALRVYFGDSPPFSMTWLTPVSPAVATATNGSLLGCQYNSSPVTATNGQQGSIACTQHMLPLVGVGDLNGNQFDPTLPQQTYESNSYLNVAAGTATTTVKSGAGTLARIIINTKGASSNTLTCYDNTAASGTKIATIDTTGGTTVLNYGVAFGIGLTCASASGTGADYTVSYR